VVLPLRLRLNTTVLEAVEVMAEHAVGAVAVVENGQLRGIFTERDVLLRNCGQWEEAGSHWAPTENRLIE